MSFFFIKMKEILQYQGNGGENLLDHILLYKHDLRSINILQLITTSAEITEGTLIEVVISCKFFALIFLFLSANRVYLATLGDN